MDSHLESATFPSVMSNYNPEIITRWIPTSYKWSYNPFKWPYKWANGVITLLITGRGPTLYGKTEGHWTILYHGILVQEDGTLTPKDLASLNEFS